MKILIIQQKMIGDVLTTSILFEALREKYPKSELDYLINSHTYPVVENNPFIDNFIFFTQEIENSSFKFILFLKSIHNEKYDIIIDVYSKITSNLITLFSGATTKISRYKSYSSLIYNFTLKLKKSPEHSLSLAIENRLLLLEPLDIAFKDYKPKIYLTISELENIKAFLKNQRIELNKPLYIVSVLGSNPQKTYPFKYMAAVLDKVVSAKPEAQILFNYIPKQERDAKSIFELCNQITQKQIFFRINIKSLRDFLAITQHCNALIGNEGGATNIAKALNVPTFNILSPYLTKQNWFGKTDTKRHIAIHLKDYMTYNEIDKLNSKKNPESYYQKLKPNYFVTQLNTFLISLD